VVEGLDFRVDQIGHEFPAAGFHVNPIPKKQCIAAWVTGENPGCFDEFTVFRFCDRAGHGDIFVMARVEDLERGPLSFGKHGREDAWHEVR
jgi:hypothetical protein